MPVVKQNDVKLKYKFDNNDINKENNTKKNPSDWFDSCIKFKQNKINIQDLSPIRYLLDYNTQDKKEEDMSEGEIEALVYGQVSDRNLTEEDIKKRNTHENGIVKFNQSFHVSRKIKQNNLQSLLNWKIPQLDGIIDLSDEELKELSDDQCLNEDLSTDQVTSLTTDDLCKSSLSYSHNDGTSNIASGETQHFVKIDEYSIKMMIKDKIL